MGELTGTVDNFIDSAKPEALLGQGAFGRVQAYIRGDLSYAVKEWSVKGGSRETDEDVALQMQEEVEVYKIIRQHPHPCLIPPFLIDVHSRPIRIVMEKGEHDLERSIQEQKTPMPQML